MVPAVTIWVGMIQPSRPLLGIGVASLLLQCATAPRWLRRRGRTG